MLYAGQGGIGCGMSASRPFQRTPFIWDRFPFEQHAVHFFLSMGSIPSENRIRFELFLQGLTVKMSPFRLTAEKQSEGQPE